MSIELYNWELGNPKAPIGRALLYARGEDEVNIAIRIRRNKNEDTEEKFSYKVGMVKLDDFALEVLMQYERMKEADIVFLGTLEEGIKQDFDELLEFANMYADNHIPRVEKDERLSKGFQTKADFQYLLKPDRYRKTS